MHPTLEQMKQLSGTYREVEFVKSDGSHQRGERVAAQSRKARSPTNGMKPREKLAAMFNGGAAKASGFGVGRGLAGSKRASHGSAVQETLLGKIMQTIPVGKLSSITARRNTLLRDGRDREKQQRFQARYGFLAKGAVGNLAGPS